MDCVEVLQSLAGDRVSSSNTIALKMIECSIELYGKYNYNTLIENIIESQPSMAVVLNVASRILRAEDKGELLRLKGEFLDAEKSTVNRAVDRLKGYRRVATISYSRTVLETLKLIRPKKVFVSVSHPAREGETLAQELISEGIDVVLFEDTAYSAVMDEVEAVFIGADAVFGDCVVNKIGSFPLALLADYFKKDFFVLANKFKFLSDELKEKYRVLNMDPSEITHLNCDVVNVYFEKVPLEFVKEIISGE